MTDIHKLWQDSVDEIKDKVTGRTVWETLDAIQPVTMDGSIAILGLPHLKSSLAGHINYPTTKNIIENVLSANAGTRISIRVIEGVTMDDWATVQRREAAAKELEQHYYERRQKEVSASAAWDELHDQVTRKYSNFANRSLANVKGKYLLECIDLVVETLDRLGEPDELAERNFSRALERIAQQAECSASVVAYLIMDKRRNKTG